jgi:hypothetical protein
MHKQGSPLRPQHSLVLAAFREHGAPATDAEMAAIVGMPGSSFRPRRRELADLGFLEKAGTRANSKGRVAALWRAVPPERVEAVREAGERRKPRRRSPDEFSLEEKLEAVRVLLRDDAVNKGLREMQGRSWSRARGRARDSQAEHERRLQAEIAAAERDRDLAVDFLKAKRNLVRTLEVIRGVANFVYDDLDRRQRGEATRIAAGHWPEVADLLEDVATAATAAEESVRESYGLADDVIDVEGFEVEEIFELTDGNHGAAAVPGSEETGR